MTLHFRVTEPSTPTRDNGYPGRVPGQSAVDRFSTVLLHRSMSRSVHRSAHQSIKAGVHTPHYRKQSSLAKKYLVGDRAIPRSLPSRDIEGLYGAQRSMPYTTRTAESLPAQRAGNTSCPAFHGSRDYATRKSTQPVAPAILNSRHWSARTHNSIPSR
jgi:hypothetical protein